MRHLANSKLDSHKLTLSLIKAAEESIEKRGLIRSADSYFSALFPLLFHPPAKPLKGMNPEGAEGESDWNAIILSLVSRFIQDITLTNDQYSELYAGLTQIPRDSALATKTSVVCASAVIAKSHGLEGRDSVLDLFRKVLLTACIDPRPKVRKQAHDSLCDIMNILDAQYKDEIMILIITAMLEASRRECNGALHLVSFLKRIFPYMDISVAREEDLIKASDHCLALGNTHLSAVCFELLELVCIGHECGTETPIIIHKMLDKHRVDGNLLELFVPWLLAISQAARQTGQRPAFVQCLEVIFDGIQSDQERILVAAKTALEHLLSGPAKEGLSQEDQEKIAASLNSHINVKKFDSFHPATLQICELVFEAFKFSLVPCFSSTIQMLAILHDRRGFIMQSEVESVLSVVCKYIGVDSLLDLVPLKLTDSIQGKNGWMINVIANGCFNDKLSVFKSRLFPAANTLLIKAEQSNEAQKRILETIASQILATISGFFRFPTDFLECFDDEFAGMLASWLTGNVGLRPVVCNMFSDFITSMQNYGIDGDSEQPRIFSNELANEYLRRLGEEFAPKYLPVLFNICIASPPDQRSYILTCIQSMLSISSSELVVDYLGKLTDRLTAIADVEQSSCLLDIAGCFISAKSDIHFSSVSPLLSHAKQGLFASDAAIQKRAYRIILIISQRPHFLELLLSDEEIISGIINIAVSCDPSARKLRFRVLMLFSDLDVTVLASLLPHVLPEVILGTKEVNHKARSCAFDLIVNWGRAFHVHNVLLDYMNMTMAGLAARTPSMMAGSILSLARLVFEFGRDPKYSSLILALLDDVVLILSSPTREVVKAAIGFVKVCIPVLDKVAIEQRLHNILSGLLQWSNEHNNHFKLRTRHIVERLMRIYGWEQILSECPEEHKKLVLNIKQTRDRKQKRKKTMTKTEEAVGASKKPFNEAMFEDLSSDSEEAIAEDDMELVDDDDHGDSRFDSRMSRKLSFKSLKSTKSLKSASAKTSKSQKSGKSVKFEASQENPEFKRNKAGKLIINESDEEIAVDGITGATDVNDDDFYNMKQKKKRRSLHGEDDSADEQTDTRTSIKSAKTQKSFKSRQSMQSHKSLKPKSQARKRGDAVRPGQHEPYAYVPLTRTGKKTKAKSSETRQKYYMKR